jgi:cobaltochelatase CobT
MLRRLLDKVRRLVSDFDYRLTTRSQSGAPYRVFTREFDATVTGAELASRPSEIIEWERSNANLDAALDFEEIAGIRRALENECAAMKARLGTQIPEKRDDTVVTLLFDHSGSLRGRPMFVVADLAETLADALAGIGIATEILGFTTRRWKGGQSLAKWTAEGHLPLPGRLNDLLHVVHLDATEGVKTGPHKFPIMRDWRLFKENIDGEALEWAATRTTSHRQQMKVLVVVTDGAPVDDATLTYNWSTLLFDHLIAVITRVEARGGVTLGAIGVEHDVQKFFAHSASAKPLGRLPKVAPSLIVDLVERAWASSAEHLSQDLDAR